MGLFTLKSWHWFARQEAERIEIAELNRHLDRVKATDAERKLVFKYRDNLRRELRRAFDTEGESKVP